jgi:ATP-binding cassette subfamily G (WHITE) protein 2 (SNQ2)
LPTLIDYNVAARLAALLISLMVIYAGYMIPGQCGLTSHYIAPLADACEPAFLVFTMKRWLFWIYYLNPLSYGFESLMVNEFM